MIEPQIHTSQRGVIGEQHGLAKLTSTLEALTQGQTAQHQRDTRFQEQLTTQAQALTRVETWRQRLVLAIGGLGVLVFVLGGLVAWQMTHRPETAYVHALGGIDAVLVQHWGNLPKNVQESLTVTYGRSGLMSPGQRK
jgi:hypothetical protein